MGVLVSPGYIHSSKTGNVSHTSTKIQSKLVALFSEFSLWTNHKTIKKALQNLHIVYSNSNCTSLSMR